MPGMRLDFLNNTSQRAATGKSMPLKQVEAVILYGKPEQRAKVVQKLLPNTYSLCLSKATHYIVLTLLDKCDGLVRVQMLYYLRKKIIDLSLSPVGNVIVQAMLERFPVQQKKEISEMFVLNTEADEFRRLCEHPFGNHVAQKLIEYLCSREVVEDRFQPYLAFLALHPYGQRVVAKYVDSADHGWRNVVCALFGDDGAGTEMVSAEKVSLLFESLNDNMTVSALLRHPLVPVGIKDGLCAHLCEYAGEYLKPPQATEAEKDEFAQPDFGNASYIGKSTGKSSTVSRHHHVYVTVFEKGDLAQKKELWKSLVAVPGLIEYMTLHKTVIAVAIAAFKTLPESQDQIWSAMMGTATAVENGGALDVVDVAQDPVRTMLLRAAIEARADHLTQSHRLHLADLTLVLSQNPVSSPVLQKLVEYFPDDEVATRRMLESIRGEIKQLITHNTASYFIQSMLQHSGSGTFREELVSVLLETFSDMREMLSSAQGSRVMQKLLAYASDEAVVAVVNAMLTAAAEEKKEPKESGLNASGDDDMHEEGLDDEGRQSEAKTPKFRRELRELNRAKTYEILSPAVISYALHHHACYVIQALLRECRHRQLDKERKLLMQELKPFVFELSVSPWAGRIVLDTMLQCGSSQLKEAMRNVVFLKAEAWLSEVSDKEKRCGGGLDPTLRQALRRGREETSDAPPSDNNSAAKLGSRKRLYRTLKK